MELLPQLPNHVCAARARRSAASGRRSRKRFLSSTPPKGAKVCGVAAASRAQQIGTVRVDDYSQERPESVISPERVPAEPAGLGLLGCPAARRARATQKIFPGES